MNELSSADFSLSVSEIISVILCLLYTKSSIRLTGTTPWMLFEIKTSSDLRSSFTDISFILISNPKSAAIFNITSRLVPSIPHLSKFGVISLLPWTQKMFPCVTEITFHSHQA